MKDKKTAHVSEHAHAENARSDHAFRKKLKKINVLPYIALSIMIILFATSIGMYFRQSKYSTDGIIAQELKRLSVIFEQIHKECQINGFAHEKNHIDFLTVKEFVGSEIGGLNLTYPQNWKGPYLEKNPSIQAQQYVLLKNKDGLYLVPGDGVVLGNGKIIGKDIVLDFQTNIKQLLVDEQGLKSSRGVLAFKVDIDRTFFQKIVQAPLSLYNI